MLEYNISFYGGVKCKNTDVPDDWTCLICGLEKNAFNVI
ncbi:rubredoxin [Lacrimispora sp.]